MQFFRHVTGGIHWKIFATVFVRFIAGEYIESIYIAMYFFRNVEKRANFLRHQAFFFSILCNIQEYRVIF